MVGEGKTGKVNGYGGWSRGVLGGVKKRGGVIGSMMVEGWG